MTTITQERTIKGLDYPEKYPIEKSAKVFIRRKPVLNNRNEDLSEANTYIGASLYGQDILRGLSFDEEKVYLKNVIGVNPNNVNWEEATKNYWNNIRVPVPHGDGRLLEVGFRYMTESDAAIAEASDDFYTKETYGIPINVNDYILYRYCLVYKDVARKKEDVHKSPKIRFYIFNKSEENQEKAKVRKIKDMATIKRISVMSDRQLVDDILVVFNEPVDNLDDTEKDIQLELYATKSPQQFIDVANDPNLKLRSLIERCIVKGFLRRLENTDTIVYGDNKILGNNIKDAVTYLSRATPESTEILNTLKARSKKNATLKAVEPPVIKTNTGELETLDDVNLENVVDTPIPPASTNTESKNKNPYQA